MIDIEVRDHGTKCRCFFCTELRALVAESSPEERDRQKRREEESSSSRTQGSGEAKKVRGAPAKQNSPSTATDPTTSPTGEGDHELKPEG